jgi:hypothetical protein
VTAPAPVPLSSERLALAADGLAWLRARVEAIEADAANIDPEARWRTNYSLRIRLRQPEETPILFRRDVASTETTPEVLHAFLDAYDAAQAELAAFRGPHGSVREEWTLGDEAEPYDGRIMREADARFFATDPDSTDHLYRRFAGDWQHVDVEKRSPGG